MDNDLVTKLRKHPNALDCFDAALAIEQAVVLLRRAIDNKDGSDWIVDANYWLNTWDRNEEEE